MSGHRRVKGIEYYGDDVDDYSDGQYDVALGDEVSSEDKGTSARNSAIGAGRGSAPSLLTFRRRSEQLRQGTVKVREALGTNYPASETEIQDALWHYYYDVAKSVSYLKNLRSPAVVQPKKPKPESRFDQAAGVAAAARAVKKGKESHISYPLVTPPRQYSYPGTAADFFADVPWLNVPLHRRGDILVEPMFPRVGLLGGSSSDGKPSKLAALAAARKQKEAEKRARAIGANFTGQAQDNKQLNTTAQLLDQLDGQASQKWEDKNDDHGVIATESDAPRGFKQRAYPTRKRKSPSPRTKPQPEAVNSTEEISPLKAQELRASPSTFAKTVLGHPKCFLTSQKEASADSDNDKLIALDAAHGASLQYQKDNAYTLPYFQAPDFAKTNAFSGPSPDDIVAHAQAKGAKGNKVTAKQVNGEKTSSGPAAKEPSTTIQEQPKAKSKHLDVVAELERSNEKNAASFVVIGHVDHGKSTLMGRLLYDLRVIDQRSVEKLRKEAETMGKSSFALAWVMDQTSEERERGVTVDIATNQFETDKTRFTILDAPGHRDFIPNMIAGASQADFAVLVIDASTNSFESGLRGQTKEHALLVRSMGVQRLIVAVNKMDTVDWSQDRFEEIKQQMSAFLTNANFQSKNIAFVPCSGLTGANIVSRVGEESAHWYTGKSLVDELEASKPAERALSRPFRLAISDVFSGGVQNPLSISGRIEQGSVQVGDTILAMPAAEAAQVKAIEVNQEPRDWAVAGQIATLHLNDIDPMHLRAGDVLCSAKDPIKNVKAFTAKILAFEHVTPGWVDCHRGRLHQSARVERLLAVLDKSTGAVVRKKPRVIKPGEVARVKVVIEGESNGVPLDVGGKVVFRSEGETLAAGVLETVD